MRHSSRRSRVPPFRRHDLPGLYLAVLVFGLVVPLLPGLGPPVPPAASPAAPAVPPVRQVEVAAPRPVVVRPAILDELPDRGTIALTFDDGPDPRWTPRVLDVLRRHGAVATFCMVSEQVAGNEHLVRQVVDAGMRLCDHSRTHDRGLPGRSADRIRDEIVGAGTIIAAAGGGAPVEWFRAPGGAWSPQIVDVAAAHGMQPLGWSVDPRDWARPGAGAIVAFVQEEVRGGAVILLHDGGGPREQTVAALEQLVPWLADQGYRFGLPVP